MTGDAWDTDLGQWALAWRDYLRAPTTGDVQRALDKMDAQMRAVAYARSEPMPLIGLDAWLGSPESADAAPASELSVSPEPIVEDADAAFAREIALAREAADPKGLLPWLASLPDDGDGTVGSDAKYRQMLAEEVCDEQIAADAATAFVPDVPLPFGGEVKSD